MLVLVDSVILMGVGRGLVFVRRFLSASCSVSVHGAFLFACRIAYRAAAGAGLGGLLVPFIAPLGLVVGSILIDGRSSFS